MHRLALVVTLVAFGCSSDDTASSTGAGAAGTTSTSIGSSTTASSGSATTANGGTDSATSTSGASTTIAASSSTGRGQADSSGSGSDSSSTSAGSGCGDGVVEPGEQCDGKVTDFNCESLGLGTGELGCDPVTCTFDTSLCTSDPGGTGGA